MQARSQGYGTDKATLGRAGAGGHEADLTIAGYEGGSSRLPVLQQRLLKAILVLGMSPVGCWATPTHPVLGPGNPLGCMGREEGKWSRVQYQSVMKHALVVCRVPGPVPSTGSLEVI